MSRIGTRVKLHWLTSLLALLMLSGARAAEPQNFKIWPKGAPNAREAMAPEKMEVRDDRLTGPVKFVDNVSEPTITVALPPRDKANGTAVIICPGGGYNNLSMDKEGTELGDWLNTFGVAGITLKYRVPGNRDGAFQDIQRAIRLVRANAAQWGINPNRVGVMGFSAGAHLAARLSTNYQKATYPPQDKADEQPLRPAFAMLIYPWDLLDGTRPSAEMPVNAQTPPTFLVQTPDDFCGVETSIYYYAALKAAGVKQCAMHIYAQGGHGYGMRPLKKGKAAISTWPTEAKQWLEDIGMVMVK